MKIMKERRLVFLCLTMIVMLILMMKSIILIQAIQAIDVIEIAVHTANDGPLKGAKVFLYNETGELIDSGTTNAEGKVTLDVKGKNVVKPTLKIYYSGILVFSKSFSSLEGIDYPIRVDVYSITFNITDYKERPLSAELIIDGSNGFSFSKKANKSGTLKILLPLSVEEGQENSFTIKVKWQGVEVYSDTFNFLTGEVPSSILLKCEVFPLSIKVYDFTYRYLPSEYFLDETLLKGATIQLTHPNGTVLTFTNSSIYLDKMSKGIYFVKVLWWGSVVLKEEKFWLLPETYLEPVKILCKVYEVTLRFVDKLGYPLNNTDFKLVLPQTNMEITVYTDENGEVRLPYVIDGTYTVYSKWHDVQSSYSIEITGPRRYTIVLPIYNIMLKIRALGAHSMPLDNALIKLYIVKGGTTSLLAEDYSNSKGELVFYKIPEALYKIEVYWHGVLVGEQYFRPETLGSLGRLEIECEVYSFRARIMDLKGAPLSNARVAMYLANGSYLVCYTNDFGLIDLGAVPKGTYSLNVSWYGVKVGSFKVALPYERNPRGDFDERLPCKVYDLKILVTGVLNQPLDGTLVEIWLSANKLGEGLTKSGVIEFNQLPPGVYIVKMKYLDVSVTDSVSLAGEEPVVTIERKLDVLFTIAGKAFSLIMGVILIVSIVVGVSIALIFIRRLLRERAYKGLISPPETFEEERRRRRKFPKLRLFPLRKRGDRAL